VLWTSVARGVRPCQIYLFAQGQPTQMSGFNVRVVQPEIIPMKDIIGAAKQVTQELQKSR